MNAADIVAHVDQHAANAVADALAEATADYWHRRAAVFEATKPAPGEFHGQATRADLSAAWNRAHRTAQACRNRAALALVERWDVGADRCRLSDQEADELARLHRGFVAVSESLGVAS